jgi:hypothetical protein
MTDERLKWFDTTGGCDVCDSNWTECVWEIRRLREENARYIAANELSKIAAKEITDENANLREDNKRLLDLASARGSVKIILMNELLKQAREDNERLLRFVASIDKAFESNKNFMWGRGLWSTISKIKRARASLYRDKS